MKRKLFCQFCGAPLTDGACFECKKLIKELPRNKFKAILVICYLILISELIFLSWFNFVELRKTVHSLLDTTSSGNLSSEIPIEHDYFPDACIVDLKTQTYHYNGCILIQDLDCDLVVYFDKSQAVDDGYKICDICAQKQKWGNI